MSKHTPGPWHRNIPPASKYPTVWSGRNTHVAAISPGAPRRSGNVCSMSEEEQEANINLIVAAPDMLAALRSIDAWWLDSFPKGPDADDLSYGIGVLSEDTVAIWKQIRAAIAKAEARQ